MLPATKPERMLSDAPPCRDDATTSRTWRESTEVNTLTNSGMMAPANVPQVMTEESFHQSVVSPLRSGIICQETMYVAMMEMIEVNQTRDVSGASKFILSTLPYLLLAMALLMR